MKLCPKPAGPDRDWLNMREPRSGVFFGIEKVLIGFLIVLERDLHRSARAAPPHRTMR